MLIADVPAVSLGDKAAPKIPFKLVRGIAALLVVALGVRALLSVQMG
jgi:Ca2+/H+ antiporter, TMEM165/GDT1 family